MPGTVTLDRAPTARPTPDQRPYQPFGAARELMRCRAREVLLAGPAGTGKSRAGLEKMHLAATLAPTFRGAIVRKTRTSLTQSAMVTFAEKVLPQPSGVWFHHADQEYRYPNGARIVVAGLDDPEKIKSTEFDLIYVQEATELEAHDWEMLLTRLRNAGLSYHQLLADCNPSHPGHWLKRRCDDGRCVLLESRHEDNPAVTPDYIATLDSLSGYLHKRLRLGLWVAAEGMYFEEWDPDRHTCPSFSVPSTWTRWLAVDYGFADPFCALWCARAPDTNRTVYVYRELYAAGLRDTDQAVAIAKACKGEKLSLAVLDPSMFNERREQEKPSIASVYAGVFRREGLFTVRADEQLPLYPASNARKAGWSVVRGLLAHDPAQMRKPRLQVMRERCPNLIRTLPAMVRDPLDPEDLADKVKGVKTEDHVLDALRYSAMVEATAPRKGPQAVRFGG